MDSLINCGGAPVNRREVWTLPAMRKQIQRGRKAVHEFLMVVEDKLPRYDNKVWVAK